MVSLAPCRKADALKAGGVAVDAVVEISVDDDEIIRRMAGRRVHLASGRTYHIVFNPPKEEGKDNQTGEPLIQRDDDQEDTVRARLDVYHEQTEPLISYYTDYSNDGSDSAPKYVKVDGIGGVDEIRDRIFGGIRHLKHPFYARNERQLFSCLFLWHATTYYRIANIVRASLTAARRILIPFTT